MKRLPSIALLVALAALAVIGWSVWHPQPSTEDATTALTLWTPGSTPTTPGAHALQLALPGAVDAPAAIARVPDAAFLRRAYPRLRQIELLGDGVTAAEAEALRGLSVEWKAPAVQPFPAPAMVALSAPRSIAVGQRLRVEGRVRGLAAGAATPLRLEGPDGNAQAIELRGNTDGEAAFALASQPTAAPGMYEWKLQLGPAGAALRLGAQVLRPDLPRVLLLQASPTVDAGRLQRWLADAGAAVTSRTRVSAEHMRFATANDAPGEFARLAPDLLRSFDVVVTTEAALLDLSPEERTALSEAVRSRGLGVLLTGEAAPTRGDSPFFLWTLKPDPTVEAGETTRVARLRLADGTELAEPITTLAGDLSPAPLQRWLVRDAQDRLVGVTTPHGRGWIARSLVVDTWRWLQGGHPEVFAAYWSGMLAATAASSPTGKWHLLDSSRPIFAHAPVRLAWVGGPETNPPLAKVAPLSGRETNLPLTHDSADPARFLGIYYPAQSGWHKVRAASGSSFAFYVHAPDALPYLQIEHRHIATVTLLPPLAPQPEPVTAPTPEHSARWIAPLALALFVLSAGILFLDSRQRQSPGPSPRQIPGLRPARRTNKKWR